MTTAKNDVFTFLFFYWVELTFGGKRVGGGINKFFAGGGDSLHHLQ